VLQYTTFIKKVKLVNEFDRESYDKCSVFVVVALIW